MKPSAANSTGANAQTTRPASATNLFINTLALLFALAVLGWLITLGSGLPVQQAAFALILAYALPVIALEAIWLPRTGNNRHVGAAATGDRRQRSGVLIDKLIGLGVTLALVLIVYWLLPEYRGDFYDRYYAALTTLAPWFAVLAIPYVVWTDRRYGGQRDGYWHLAALVTGRHSAADLAVISQHLLGWLVKLFFLPLMYTYLLDKIGFYRSFDFSDVFGSFKAFFDFTLQSLFFVDLLIACVGYIMTFKATDSHIRSTEPTLLGWMVALMCYQPFWSFVSVQYLDYSTGKSWGSWFWDYPPLYVAWGTLILLLMVVYAWSTVSFGIRFSNLTHRGIITGGPYRYCKHPAYVSKNISWWLISMPFMLNVSASESLRACLLLLFLNGIYLLRARTEERHLSSDPVYRDYAAYIEEQGLLRWVGNRIPALKFSGDKLFHRH